MGKKDITEKLLASYNDVFADIVNVLLFNGEEIIKEDELEPETARSSYKFAEAIHEQERDVAKFWKNSNVRIALYGLENQTALDIDMPLRVISYDGASYRGQLSEEGSLRYPVVTLVLYFGEKHWEKPKSLLECLEIPEELKPYVSDYKINIFEIAWLTDEQVQMFKSDFKCVADYFVQVRKNKDYIPSKEELDHVEEVLQLMAALTDDKRFEEVQNEAVKGEKKKMSEILDKIEARGRMEGRKEGEARGRREGRREFSYETAKSMIADNMPISLISKYTGLTEAQVLKFQEETADYN